MNHFGVKYERGTYNVVCHGQIIRGNLTEAQAKDMVKRLNETANRKNPYPPETEREQGFRATATISFDYSWLDENTILPSEQRGTWLDAFREAINAEVDNPTKVKVMVSVVRTFDKQVPYED